MIIQNDVIKSAKKQGLRLLKKIEFKKTEDDYNNSSSDYDDDSIPNKAVQNDFNSINTDENLIDLYVPKTAFGRFIFNIRKFLYFLCGVKQEDKILLVIFKMIYMLFTLLIPCLYFITRLSFPLNKIIGIDAILIFFYFIVLLVLGVLNKYNIAIIFLNLYGIFGIFIALYFNSDLYYGIRNQAASMLIPTVCNIVIFYFQNAFILIILTIFNILMMVIIYGIEFFVLFEPGRTSPYIIKSIVSYLFIFISLVNFIYMRKTVIDERRNLESIYKCLFKWDFEDKNIKKNLNSKFSFNETTVHFKRIIKILICYIEFIPDFCKYSEIDVTPPKKKNYKKNKVLAIEYILQEKSRVEKKKKKILVLIRLFKKISKLQIPSYFKYFFNNIFKTLKEKKGRLFEFNDFSVLCYFEENQVLDSIQFALDILKFGFHITIFSAKISIGVVGTKELKRCTIFSEDYNNIEKINRIQTSEIMTDKFSNGSIFFDKNIFEKNNDDEIFKSLKINKEDSILTLHRNNRVVKNIRCNLMSIVRKCWIQSTILFLEFWKRKNIDLAKIINDRKKQKKKKKKEELKKKDEEDKMIKKKKSKSKKKKKKRKRKKRKNIKKVEPKNLIVYETRSSKRKRKRKEFEKNNDLENNKKDFEKRNDELINSRKIKRRRIQKNEKKENFEKKDEKIIRKKKIEFINDENEDCEMEDVSKKEVKINRRKRKRQNEVETNNIYNLRKRRKINKSLFVNGKSNFDFPNNIT